MRYTLNMLQNGEVMVRHINGAVTYCVRTENGWRSNASPKNAKSIEKACAKEFDSKFMTS